MRVARNIWLALLSAGAATACSAILGIEAPVVDGLPLLEGGPDVRVGDDEGGASAEGGTTCVAPRADCNGGTDGCETDLMTSAANCGACGHTCIVTACVAGRCVPQTLQTGAPLTDYSGYTGLSSTRVVWANQPSKGVFSAPKGGGTFLQYFGTTAFAPTTLDVHDAFFVVADYDFYGVARYAIAGGGFENPKAETCATGLGAVADAAGAVYYAHLNDTGECLGAIFHITKRVPQVGGAYATAWDIPVSTFNATTSKWMVLDANNLYFDSSVQPTAPNGIYAVSRVAGGIPSLVKAGGYLSSPMALDGTTLYTIENIFSAAPEVVAIDLSLKTRRVVTMTEHGFFEGTSNVRAQIAVDATHVYWTTAVGAENPSVFGRIMRAPKDGSGTSELVVGDEGGLHGMAIDESFVYWSSTTAIKRVAK